MAQTRNGAQREEIHFPGPSLLPLATAVGIALALVGLIISWAIVAVGVLIFVIAVARWLRTVREEIEELPQQQRR